MTIQHVKPKFHYADFVTFTETSRLGKLRTQYMKVRNTNHVADFHVTNFCDLCLWQSPRTLTLSPTFHVYCNRLNFIRTTQTSLSRTLSQKSDMSRWFLSATFMTCVGNFHQKLMISWFVTVWVRNVHDMWLQLSPQESFSKSRRNGIWP